ncbi:hypothetical protein EUX98_g4837 [Antrodiella citrinella]|uniref:Uncharacterized protein n=1 Tax=Antrodiella citrinella TaxID=2447956 RepID=A0A4S4MVF1_9APHY|nr:hypothetical protein EUX98_g4837 [Antrodiella citrinella]
MPSFAERQAIQKKYNIDRRHIYDWYHTKGLRVSTKEKDAGSKGVDEGKVLRSRIPQRLIKQRPVQIELPSVSTSSSTMDICPPDSSSSSSCPSTPLMPLTPSTAYNLPAYESGIQPTAFPIQYFFDEPFPVDDPMSTNNCSPPPAAVEWNRRAQADPSESSPVSSETVFPISYEQPLPQDQREAYYQYLATTLGPAHGVQESVGSYKAFMTQQVQTYYERLLPSDLASVYPAALGLASTPASSSMLPCFSESLCASSHAKPQHQETDYGKWLLYAGRSLNTSAAPSTVSTPSEYDINASWFWGTPQDSGSVVESSLDISDILKSPVLRSRHPTMNSMAPGETSISATTLNDLIKRVEDETSCLPTVEGLPSGSNSRQSSPYAIFSSQTDDQFDGSYLDLRTAKGSQGLEKMAEATSTRSKERSRTRTRTRHLTATTVSAGGDV